MQGDNQAHIVDSTLHDVSARDLGNANNNDLDTLHTASTSDLDTLVNPIPPLNSSTNLTRIDSTLPRRPGQTMTDNERTQVQAAFLSEFSKRANVTQSCAIAHIDRGMVYYWLQHDLAFAGAYEVAEQEANDVLRQEAYRRAVEGVSEPIVSMGKVVRDDDGSMLTVQKYDTPLLMMLMRARMPEYKESKQVDVNNNTTINTSHTLSIDVRGMSQDELAQLRAIAEGVKSREQARIEKTGKAPGE